MTEPIREFYVGMQWGDEGKGKLVDEAVWRAKELEDGKRIMVARYNGGANAGHTVYYEGEDGLQERVTHASSTGASIQGVDIAIGPHVAFDPERFLKEIGGGIKSGRILISERVGVLLDYHRRIDAWREDSGSCTIGTTKSGIGPFYEDNSRRQTRITFDQYLSDRFPDRLREVLEMKRDQLAEAGIAPRTRTGNLLRFLSSGRTFNRYLDELVERHRYLRKDLAQFAVNLEYVAQEYLKAGHHIIIEGAQGTMLDVDMGSTPNVTSSHVLASAAFGSLGLPRSEFGVYGVEKVFPTRVGGGVLPTEDHGGFGRTVQRSAGEIGATTGRPRRVGYPDWVISRRSAFLNDCDGMYLMRADNVQGWPLRVAVGYITDNGYVEEVPRNLGKIEAVNYSQKEYQWRLWDGFEDLSDPTRTHEKLKRIRRGYVGDGFGSLPEGLREFVRDHDEYASTSIVGVSIGPARGETVRRGLPL